MKKMIVLLTVFMMMIHPALGEDGIERYVSGIEASRFEDGIYTVVRPDGQPYLCVCEKEDVDAYFYLDFVEDPNLDLILIRMTLTLESYEEIRDDTLNITIGNQNYQFKVTSTVNEYDMLYMEDYAVCFSSDSINLLSTIGKNKKTPIEFRLTGFYDISGTITIPAADAKEMYDKYKKAGGLKQDLSRVAELYPCDITGK